MQIKQGLPTGCPCFLIYRLCYCRRAGSGASVGLRQVGRGALLPANPCSFVAGHHAFVAGWASGKLGVVLYSPQTLVPSSRGTTPLGSDGLRQVGRGALLPASPCSFVAGHHVSGAGWASGKLGVVLYSPLTLVPSSRGTTSLGSNGPPASWTWCSAPRKPLFLRHGAPRL